MEHPDHNSTLQCFLCYRYTDNQLAQDAMNLTFFHWGVHGWIVYVVVGLLLAFVCYRQGLPMTVRSCFYPLIGDKIYGWMGDVIDILSICGTMFGVCTSLGLGAIQLNAGTKCNTMEDTLESVAYTLKCYSFFGGVNRNTATKISFSLLFCQGNFCFSVLQLQIHEVGI